MRIIFQFKTKISILLIFLIPLFFFGNIYVVNSVNLLTKTHLISNQSNGFILITYSDTKFEVYDVSENGISMTSSEKIPVNSYFYANDCLYLLSINEQNVVIIKCGKNGGFLDTGIISNISLKNNCITAIKNDFIYVVDRKNPEIVYKYTLSGIEVAKYNLNKNITSLFVYKSNDTETVCAVTNEGIIFVESNNFVSCTVPEAPYNFFGNYCCDNKGNVFKFDIKNGFELYMQTDYKNLCVLYDTVYGVKDTSVYMLNNDGTPKAEYKIESDIQQLCVSGSKMSILYNDNIKFLYEDDFVYTQSNEKNQDIQNNNQSNEEVSQSYNINQNNTMPEYSILSSIYSIHNDLITNIPQGTTIAQFKKNIVYNSDIIKFTNHNGQVKTSGQIGTGWKVEFISDDKTVCYYTIISGDVTGEGNINSYDINKLSDYLLCKLELSKYKVYAADINGDNVVNSFDLFLIDKSIK